jgi:glucose/arabinose dehydrogenase
MIVGCTPGRESWPAPIDVANGLRAEYLVTGTPSLSALAIAGDGDGRVFYAERETGWIRVIKDGQLLDAPFATVPVNSAGDRGLLGLALHPRFSANGRVYAFYSRSDTGSSTSDPLAIVDQRVVYFSASGDVASGGEVFVAALPVGAGTLRIGGGLGFTPDGTLYVGLGDTEDFNAAQVADSPLGKILRYHDDGTVPADNPTAGSAIYARGLCNPCSLTFHPETGVPFVLDRNAHSTSEVNRVQAARNYGWPAVVGFADDDGELAFVASTADYADPVAESARLLTGLSFNPSTKYGVETLDQLFYGTADDGRIRRLAISADGTAPDPAELFAAGLPQPLEALTISGAGALYVAAADGVLVVRRTK